MSEAAEAAVLGALLADSSCVDEIADFLQPDDFLNECNRLIYQAVVYKASIGDPVNMDFIADHLKSRRKLTAAGGVSYLAHLCSELPDVISVKNYAEVIKQDSIAYQLRGLGRHLLEHTGDARTEMGWALQRLMDMSRDSVVGEPQHLGDIVGGVLRETIKIKSGEAQEEGIRTLYPKLDSMLLYLKPQDLIILAARPSIGKSALAACIAANVARQNIGVLFVSLEMSKEQLGRRMLSVESGIPYTHIASPSMLSNANCSRNGRSSFNWLRSSSGAMSSRISSTSSRISAGVIPLILQTVCFV